MHIALLKTNVETFEIKQDTFDQALFALYSLMENHTNIKEALILKEIECSAFSSWKVIASLRVVK